MTPRLLASTLAALLVLAGCGGSSSPSPTDRGEPPIAAALAVAQPGEMVEEARRLVRKRGELLAQQAGSGVSNPSISLAGEPVMVAQATSADRAASAAPTAESGIAYTGTTTLQEARVDEDDLVKTDGSLIYALQRAGWYGGGSQPDRLHRYERQADGSLSEPLVLDLPIDERTHISMRGMLVAPQGGRIALIGEANTWFAPIDCPPDRACILGGSKFYSAPKTVVQWVEAGGASAMLGERIEIDGSLIGTRRIGDYLYLVMTHTPQLAAESLWIAAAGDPVAREAALASIRIEDLMPTLSVVGGPSQLALEETDCHLQTANQSNALQLTLVLAFDMRAGPSAESGPIWTGRCFLGGTEALYMAPQSLYLATTRYPATTALGSGRVIYSAQARTDIHKFAIDGPSIRYRGSGEVPGHLGWNRDRAAYRMSEHQGDLRVLSYTGPAGWASVADAADASRPASPATLTVLRERPEGGGNLQPIATLPNAKRPAPLGKPGEQIYGVRFAGELAYLVTFRQIDPLYVVDLSEPTDPRVRGELEMPGYSDYLYPLPGNLLLGIGKDASLSGMVGGIKLGLYNLSNPDVPEELSTMILGGTGSVAALDYSSHGVSLYTQGFVTAGALPVWLSSVEAGAETGRGLQIFEIDQVAKTLGGRKFVKAVGDGEGAGIESDRALMVGGDVYYWAGGKMGRVE